MNLLRWTRFRVVPQAYMVVVLGIFGVACDSAMAPVPDPQPFLQTSSSTYPLTASDGWVSTEIAYAFTNLTGAEVYLVNCLGGFDLQLQRQEGATWRPVWSPALSACLSDPIVVGMGEVFSDTLTVVGALPGTAGFPDFDSSQPGGTYRIVWQAALSSYKSQLPFGDPIALASRTSNAFELELR